MVVRQFKAPIDLSVLLLLTAGACGRGGLRLPLNSDANDTRASALEVRTDFDTTNEVWEAVDAAPTIPEDGAVDAGAQLRLSDVVVFANCGLVTPPDPIFVRWTVAIQGAIHQSSATMTAATLSLVNSGTAGGTPFRQQLTVDAPTFALSGGVGTMTQSKTGADHWSDSVCVAFCRNTTWSLELTFDVGTASANGVFTCPK